MNTPASYHPYLEELTTWASTEVKKPGLLQAKAEYFQLTGEIFEDDKSFELRMASFLDYYLFDRPQAGNGKTPAQEYFDLLWQTRGGEAATPFRAFTETVHGLFEVRKLAKDKVRLRDLFTGKDFDITERRQMAGLEKGDIIEARLIPFDGLLLFSAAFCYHPKAAVKAILKEVKRRKKKEPERPARELAWECAKRALKADRYRQIAVEKIYDFENARI